MSKKKPTKKKIIMSKKTPTKTETPNELVNDQTQESTQSVNQQAPTTENINNIEPQVTDSPKETSKDIELPKKNIVEPQKEEPVKGIVSETIIGKPIEIDEIKEEYPQTTIPKPIMIDEIAAMRTYTDYDGFRRRAVTRTWKKQDLIFHCRETFKDQTVEVEEYSYRQIAFIISGKRVPSDGYFSVI